MRLVLCDDNRMLCEALGTVLEARGHQVLAITTRASESVAAVVTHGPDACLLDLRFPDGDGLDAAREMRRQRPETKVVVLSCLTDPGALSAARNMGVAGYLRKDQKATAIAGAIDAIGNGGTAHDPQFPRQARRQAAPRSQNLMHSDGKLETLTPREIEVLRRIVAGQDTARMAREMKIATSTLRSYIKNILAKLGAHSRLQAAAIARRAADRGRPSADGEPGT
jgi:two-component system, NarL family, nitrate/nitrite response regulator NarL